MVRIADVARIPLHAELDEPFANGQGFVGHREYLLIRVEASDGTVGYGECAGPVAGHDQIVERVIAPALTGVDAGSALTTLRDVARALRRSFKSYLPLGAVGGVELALWDLAGKLTGQSVARLLAGRHHERVTAYVTGHYFRRTEALAGQIDHIVTEARGHVDAGFRLVKAKVGLSALGYHRDADLTLLSELRQALPAGTGLMADANCAYGPMQARRVARHAEELGYEWLEEPLPADDLAGYRALADDVAIPVTAGESWGDAAVFRSAVAQRCVDLIQPDVVAAGGLGPAHEIGRLAAAHGLPCQPHVWGTPIAMAAALQLLAARPEEALFEYDRSPNPIRDGILGDQLPLLDGGVVAVPDEPGLGIRVDPDVLERFRDRR